MKRQPLCHEQGFFRAAAVSQTLAQVCHIFFLLNQACTHLTARAIPETTEPSPRIVPLTAGTAAPAAAGDGRARTAAPHPERGGVSAALPHTKPRSGPG